MKNILIVCCLCISMVLQAQERDSVLSFGDAYKRVYNITKIPESLKPAIDGRLDDELWTRQGAWTDRFVQVMPYERHISPSVTRAKLFYDDKNIYVGVYCKAVNNDAINRFIGNRDDNTIGDIISIAFDTYHDFRAAPEFNINAGGNKTDLVVTDKLEVNKSWNAVWEGRTHWDSADTSWTVELRIPFSQLRYNRITDDGVWGLHIRRVIRYNNEVQNFSLIPLKNNGHVFSFGEMHGMDSLPKPRGIEIQPYVMGKFKREPAIAGSPYQTGHHWYANAGLDAKAALSDYTMDLTINPDFGQVELDPSVMNLTVYETFYDEKRPFFLEGKHILDFTEDDDNMMFYTRRIGAAPSITPSVDNNSSFAETKENVPILGALKLTGTNRHGLTIGVIESLTGRSSAKVTREVADGWCATPPTIKEIMETVETVEPLTNYTVARMQKNWKGNTLLGGMLTSVNRALNAELEPVMTHHALTAGVDFTQYFKNRLYYLDVKAMMSSLHGSEEAITALQQNAVHYYQRVSAQDYLGVRRDRTSLSGTGGLFKVGRRGNAKWIWSESFAWSSPGFELNDVGYLKQTDFKRNVTELSFKQTDTWRCFRSNTVTVSQSNQWDYGGTAIKNDISLKWRTMLMNRFEWDVTESYVWNYLDTRMLRGGPDMRFNPHFITSATVNTDKSRRVIFTFQYTGEHNTDGNNKYNTLQPKLTFRLGNHVYLSSRFSYAWNRDNLQYVSTLFDASGTDGLRADYLMANMKQQTYGLTLNLQVNLTPDISLQFYGAPYTSTAKYQDFKLAADTKSSHYSERFVSISDNLILNESTNKYEFKDLSHQSFDNPNFNFNEFRSNFVARWEYLPGSTLYLVWEHRMSNRQYLYIPGWSDNLNRMFDLPATNVFMVKLNYWFNL